MPSPPTAPPTDGPHSAIPQRPLVATPARARARAPLPRPSACPHPWPHRTAAAPSRRLGLRVPPAGGLAAQPGHACRRGRRSLGASPCRRTTRPLPRTSTEEEGQRERERGRRPTRKARRTTEAGRSLWWWPEGEKKPCASSASPASRDLAGPAARDLAVPPTPLGHPPPDLAKIRAGEGGDRGVDSAERGDEGAAAAIRFGPAGLLHGPVQERRRSVREGGLEADARCGRRCYSRAPRER
ncbi:unnamed protein product [Urochloa humidicola]